MSEADDWWAQNLGAPVAQRQTPLYAPQAPVQQPQAPQYQQPGQNPYAPYQQQPQPQSLQQAIAMDYAGNGGQAARTETGACPSCGGNQYFSRKGEGSFGMPPAPRCFTCGYNGRFTQDPDAPMARS